jgi:hypothetical protein
MKAQNPGKASNALGVGELDEILAGIQVNSGSRFGPKGFVYSDFIAALELGTRQAILPNFPGE